MNLALFSFELCGGLCQFQLYFRGFTKYFTGLSTGAIFIVCLLITSRSEFLLNLRAEICLEYSYQF